MLQLLIIIDHRNLIHRVKIIKICNIKSIWLIKRFTAIFKISIKLKMTFEIIKERLHLQNIINIFHQLIKIMNNMKKIEHMIIKQ